MTESQNMEKITAIGVLAENYGAHMTKEMIAVWLRLLRRYDARSVQNAVFRLMESTGTEKVPFKTMVPFAHLKRELDSLSGAVPREKAARSGAEKEWDGLMEQISRVGYYGNPQLHPVTGRVVRMLGGWRSVCSWKNDELQWRMKDFIELWKNAAENAELMALDTEAILSAIGGGKKPAALNSGRQCAAQASAQKREKLQSAGSIH